MVALSFMPRFVPAIVAGTKLHTLRWPRHGRSRHARPGELLQLYTGMRTRHCRRIGVVPCKAVVPLALRLRPFGIGFGFGGQQWPPAGPIDAEVADWVDWVGPADDYHAYLQEMIEQFCRQDGFATRREFTRHWLRACPRLAERDTVACLVMIGWEPDQATWDMAPETAAALLVAARSIARPWEDHPCS